MQKSDKIFITGATGLLGPHIVKELCDKGYSDITVLIRSGKLNAELEPFANKLTVIKGDILDLHPLQEIIAESDYVIHVAAMVSFDPKERKMMHKINVEGTANIVNLCLASEVKKLVHISSVAAIGRSEKQDVINESTPWSESHYNPYYGVTKYRSELEVWRGFTEGLPVAIINPSIILGQGDYSRSSLKMVDLVAKGLSHYPVGSVGIVDARDVASLTSYLMESDISGERYIATATSIKFKSLFDKIAHHTGAKPPAKPMTKFMSAVLWRLEAVRAAITRKSPIVTKETMKSSSYSAIYDTSKSMALPGFSYTNIEDTIRWTCEGYMSATSKA